MAQDPPLPPRPLTGAGTGPGAGTVLAVDIGGTKLAVGIVGPSGAVLAANQSPTPRGTDASGVWRVLAGLVRDVLDWASGSLGNGPLACGVGCGGPMTPGGATVSPLNIPAWRGFPLRAELERLTGMPAYVDNDAKALALAEGRWGAAAGRRDYIAMVVSTGVGGGIVLDGRLLEGRLANAGHVGHVVVEPEGRPCGCGGRGCLEAEASGTAIAAVTGRPAAEASPAVVGRAGTLVGRAVASVAALLDLDLAVVSGSVALGFGEPFFAAAREELSQRAKLDFVAQATIVPGALGAAGPLAGAGAVAMRATAAARMAAGVRAPADGLCP